MKNEPQNNRQRLIKLIHVAKRDLRMDEDSYRAMLRQIGGAESSSAMNVPKLETVLEHMKRCGFKVRPKRGDRPFSNAPQDKKIRAIWLDLHAMGAVKNPSEAALAAFVKRMTGVEALQWLSAAQASKVIEELKKWRDRMENVTR